VTVFAEPFGGAPALARKMDGGLLASLGHLGQACAAVRPSATEEFAQLAAVAESGQALAPAHYGLHFDLIDAIADSDEDRIDALLALIGGTPTVTGLSVVALDGAEFDPTVSESFRRHIDADADRALGLVGPSGAGLAAGRREVAAALDLVAEVAPALAAETDALVRQIVLAGDQPGGSNPFFGASTFFLWGGVFLNPSRHEAAVDLADTIVHETGHLKLFALSVDEPMTRNPSGARYRSPLRNDPRPMEGIFHATYVCARMAGFYAQMAENAGHHHTRVLARRRIEESRQAFGEGLGTIRREARLTAAGEAILMAAEKSLPA
jgi:hypothetical protein